MQLLERRQFHRFSAWALASTFLLRWQGKSRPRLAFVLGDHEYSSEQTLPLFAAEFGRAFDVDCVVLRSWPDQNAEESIPGLEWLDVCDAALFFLRWRRLPSEQLAHIDAFLRAGKGVVGMRTTTHAFNYPSGHPSARWNAFGEFALGGPPGWGAGGHTHYGHTSRTRVELAPGAGDSELLRGVSGPFEVRSWLYHVVPDYPAKAATSLLIGTSLEPEHGPAVPSPVAWTWRNEWKGRAFMTTLGHPQDFRAAALQRLLANGLLWSLGRDVPTDWSGPWKIDVAYRG